MNPAPPLLNLILTASIQATIAFAAVILVLRLTRHRVPVILGYALLLIVLARFALPVRPHRPFEFVTTANPKIEIPAVTPGTVDHTAVPSPEPSVEIARTHYWLMAWLSGAALVIGIAIRDFRRLKQQIRTHGGPPNEIMLQSLVAAGRRLRLNRLPPLHVVPHLPAPCLFGFARPVLLLPPHAENWSTSQLELIFLHELIHLKRHHLLQNWLFLGISSIHWFNPAVWMLTKQITRYRELLCDGAALRLLNPEQQTHYGLVLLSLAESPSEPAFHPSVATIRPNPKTLHERIVMIKQFKSLTSMQRGLIAGTCIVFATILLTRAAEKSRSAPTPVEPAASLPPLTLATPPDLTAAPVAAIPNAAPSVNPRLLELKQKLEAELVDAQAEEAAVQEDPRLEDLLWKDDSECIELKRQLQAIEDEIVMFRSDLAPAHPQVKSALDRFKRTQDRLDNRKAALVKQLHQKSIHVQLRLKFINETIEKKKKEETKTGPSEATNPSRLDEAASATRP